MTSLGSAARQVLLTADPTEKARASRRGADAWRAGRLPAGGFGDAPDRPARPSRPVLVEPGAVRRRRIGVGTTGRVALLHALAHIELNAIDLAWDLIARFGDRLPLAALDDWVRVGDEEATHFLLLADRLAAFDTAYGDLPAHDGLWQAAGDTAHDLLARLAIVPLVLEARGLDVTPAMAAKLAAAGDTESAAILERIYTDEIGHVATGMRWFRAEAASRGVDPEQAWPSLVRRHFRGRLKPPFDHEARATAGLDRVAYEALA